MQQQQQYIQPNQIVDLNKVPKKDGPFNKLTKIVSVFFGFNGILLSLLLTYFYFAAYDRENAKDLRGIINYISDNINNAPISNIHLSDRYCETGYKPIDIYQFRGTVQGCVCGTTIRQDNCNSCTSVSSTYKQDLFKWYDKIICVKRMEMYEYNYNTCQTGFIRCNTNICVHEKDPNGCPITVLKIVDNSNIDYQDYKTSATAELPITNDKTLFFWKELDEQGIYTLTASIDNEPCLDETKDPPLLSGSQLYPLADSEHDCGEYGQDQQRSQDVDNMSYYDFLVFNSMQREIQTLPRFESYTVNQNVILFGRQQIIYKSNVDGCGEFGVSKFDQLDPITNSIMNVGFIYFVVKYVFFCGLIFTIALECCKNKGQLQKMVSGVSQVLMVCSFCLNFTILQEGSYVYYYYNQKTEIEDYYRLFGENECFYDQNIVNFFKDLDKIFSDQLENYDSMSFIALWWGGFLFFVLLLLHCGQMSLCCLQMFGNRKHKKYQKGDQYQPLVDNPYVNNNDNPYSIHSNNNNNQFQQQQNLQMELQNLYAQDNNISQNNQQEGQQQYVNFYEQEIQQQQPIQKLNSSSQHSSKNDLKSSQKKSNKKQQDLMKSQQKDFKKIEKNLSKNLQSNIKPIQQVNNDVQKSQSTLNYNQQYNNLNKNNKLNNQVDTSSEEEDESDDQPKFNN